MTTPLSKEEILAVRKNAERGILPSNETLAKFISAIRKGWAALPKASTEGKSRNKKAAPDEKQIDFF